MKRTALALAAIAAGLTLSACGNAEAPETQPVVRAQDVQISEPVEPTAEVVDSVPVGAAQQVEGGTMRVVRIETDAAGAQKVVIEVSTSDVVTFDGTYTATDAAGNTHLGVPALDAPKANGIGGWFVTFDAPQIVTVTYAPADGAPVSWVAG